jgi:hypothetical protein
MAWPSVTAGQTILASQFDDLSASVQAWRGDVSASGYALNDIATAYFHQPINASWQEFRYTVSGASQAADVFTLQYNSRTTSGGTDSWHDVLSVAVATGAVTFASAVTFSGSNGPLIATNNLSDLTSTSTARTNLGLGTAATQNSTAFDAAGAASAAVASIPFASSTTAGLLTNSAFNIFNSKQSALTFGNLTETTSSVLTITGGTGAIVGSGLTVQVKQASGSQNGYLSSADWNTFNGKQAALGYTPLNPANNLSEVTAATARTNLGLGTAATQNSSAFDAAGAATAAVAAIPNADATHTGLLTSANWSTFNAKQSALTFGNLTEATSAVLTITGGTAAVIGSGASIQVKQASASQAGYLSSTDWSTFNGKQAALGYTPLNPANNLSEVTPATARTNLGLGTAATQASSTFVTIAGVETISGQKTFSGSVIVAASLNLNNFIALNFSGTAYATHRSYVDSNNVLQLQAAASSGTWASYMSVSQSGAMTVQSTSMLNIVSSGTAGWLQMTSTTANAAGIMQYRFIALPNGSGIASDSLFMQANSRSTSGGADVWNTVFTIQATNGIVTFNNGVGFSTPAGIVFGSNWVSYTPTVTPAGSMTYSGLSFAEAVYLRVGPLMYFKFQFTITLGGPVSPSFSLSLPTSNIGTVSLAEGRCNPSGSTQYTAFFCYAQNSSATLICALDGSNNWPANTYIFLISGFYRAA